MTITSSVQDDISCSPVLCGAREKRFVQFERILAEIQAFQVIDCFFFRAQMAETERKNDVQEAQESSKSIFVHASMAEAIIRSPGSIIKLKYDHHQVNLLFPVTPWQSPFKKASRDRNGASE